MNGGRMATYDEIYADADLDEDAPPAPSTGDEIPTLIDHLLWGRAIEELDPPEPLVGSWLMRDSLAVLYGAPKAGKSFAAIDVALSVATGTWWHGHEVYPGPVLYVVAESARSFKLRVEAWRTHRNVHDISRVAWLTQPVDLFDERPHLAELRAVCDAVDPVLVVFDTLARCAPGCDENSAKDVGRVVGHLDRVRRSTGACVLAVHHSGKDTSRGMRGSSALLGAVDTVIEVKSAERKRTLTVTDQRDGEPPPTLWLGMEPVGGSVVLDRRAAGPTHEEVMERAGPTLEALDSIEVPGGVTSSVWRETCEENGTSRATFHRHLKLLVERGLVSNLGTDRTPRYVTAKAETNAGSHPGLSEVS